jgi:hypothetical protein
MSKPLSLILLLSCTIASVFAQDSGNTLERYCFLKNGEGIKGEIITTGTRPKLTCPPESKQSDQAFYELTKISLDPDNKFVDDAAFFASDKWDNYIRGGILGTFAKDNQVDVKTCVLNKKGTEIKCAGKKSGAVDLKGSKSLYQDRFEKGYKAYAADNKPKLKEIFANEWAESNKKKEVPGVVSGPLSNDFWDDMNVGQIVVLEESERKKALAIYNWTDPNGGQNGQYTWKTLSNNTPVIIIDDSQNSPVTYETPIIVIQDKTVVLEDQINKSPIVIQKLDLEKDVIANDNDNTVKEDNIKKDENESDCKEKLNLEIAKLLEDDKKNIIGLQFELTVLKMASAATGAKTNSLEGLIRQQSAAIKAIDKGVIDKMNAMYKAHGLTEDATAITDHLKEKSNSASYFPKDKRFFNQDSSAFLLAYQSLNPESGIKDSDVSVLWFMDKVSEKAKTPNGTKMGTYSIEHNLTNLSTRIAQYTGTVDPTKAISKEKLDEMVKKQKTKIDTEFLALITSFKQSNLACYNEIFSEGENECNVGQVEVSFSELLAVNSKIASADMVSLDGSLKGGIDKTRFKISKYVD